MDEIQAVLADLMSMISVVTRQPTPVLAKVEVISSAPLATTEAATGSGSQQDAETQAHHRIKGSTKKAAVQRHIKKLEAHLQ